jgi:hypothetical protein
MASKVSKREGREKGGRGAEERDEEIEKNRKI